MNYKLLILFSVLFSLFSLNSFSQCSTPTTTTGSRCGEGSVTVSASSVTGNYRWYEASSGGNILGNDASFNTPIIASTTDFYVSEFNTGTTNDMLTFDGVDDYVAIQDMHFITTELEFITIEAWVKTSVSGDGTFDNWSIVDFDRSEYFNVFVRGDNGYVGFSTTDNTGHIDDFYGVTAVNDGSWHHIAAVYDGTDKRIYVDGVLDATDSNPHGGKDLGTGETRYGFLGDGSEADSYNGTRNNIYYEGSSDEIRIWSTVRTATEISNDKDKCVTEGQDDLMLYYRMDGSGSDLTDYSGNNYNGTLMNMSSAWGTTGPNLTNCPTCESSRASVSAEIKPAPDLDLGGDKCVPNTSVTLDAGDGGGTFTTYSWNTGATTQTINVNSNGTYTVEVGHNVNSCKSTDAVSVSLLAKPDGTDKDRCGEGTVDLEVDNPNSTTYHWYDVATGGTAIGTGVNYTTPDLAADKSYYVAEIDNTEYKEALHFDGSDDKVAIDNFTYSGSNYTEMTVEAWIRTSDASDQIIASFDRSEYWRLEVNGSGATSGKIGFDISTDNGILDFGGSTSVSDGNWHHIAAVYASGSLKIYIDGYLDASDTLGTKFGTGVTGYGYIGVGSEARSYNNRTGPDNYFNGDIDELRIWSVARNITQIQNNKDGCLTGSETGLEAYYKMEDGTGTTLSDHSNNNSIGELINMTNADWINTGKNIECSCGESDRKQIDVTINAIPSVDLGADRCEANTVTLDAGNAGGGHTYLWQDNSSNQTLDAATSQQYWVHVTDVANSCVGADTVEISIGVTAKPTTTDGSRCGNGTVDLAVSNSNTIRWYDQATGDTLLNTGLTYTTPTLSANTDYYVSADEGSSCGESAREKITAVINPTVTGITTTKSWPGDNGSVISLVSAGGSGKYDYTELQGNFDYSGSYTSASVEKTVPNGGSYDVRAKDENGCEFTVTGETTKQIPTSISTSTYNSSSLFVPQRNDWYYISDNNSKAIVAIKSASNNLGDVNVNLYVDGSTGEYDGYAYLKRHFVINVENQPTSDVDIKLLFSNSEFNSLKSAANANAEPLDDIASISDLGSTKYEGPTEDGTYDPSDATSLKFISQNSSGSDLNGQYILIKSNSFSEFWIHASGGSSALPIELVSFDATLINNSVLLSWTTMTETNNDYFTLQCSKDNKEFYDIGNVDGAGNSNVVVNYEFMDKNPLIGISYYRLKQTDFDGKFTYSNTEVVNRKDNNKAKVSIYPNPVINTMNIDIVGFVSDNKVDLQIYTSNGSNIIDKVVSIDKEGNANIAIENNLKSGVYFVRIIGNSKVITNKVIIK